MDPNLKEMLLLYYWLGLSRGFHLGVTQSALAKALGQPAPSELPTQEEAAEAFEELLTIRPEVTANLNNVRLVRA